MLEMKHITKRFPGIVALNDVSLSLKRGEVHALVGENGAGKSTLMKILSGVYQADEGELLVDGAAIHPTRTRESEKLGINIIFQEFSLVPDLNASENIFLGREIRTKLARSTAARCVAWPRGSRPARHAFPARPPVADLTVPSSSRWKSSRQPSSSAISWCSTSRRRR
jgi:monosaccharide ABC transporter ATP-binding protein, CUT2 family (TC 3.A.1.2.-)